MKTMISLLALLAATAAAEEPVANGRAIPTALPTVVLAPNSVTEVRLEERELSRFTCAAGFRLVVTRVIGAHTASRFELRCISP